MLPGTVPITGTNSQFTPAQRAPLPEFLTRQFRTPELQIGRADVSSVDPQYRDIYRQFNQSIGALQGQREAAIDQANVSRDLLAQNLTRGTQAAEQERIRAGGAARQGADEAQTRARQRIRAIGGAPSSASLELSNRIDRDTLQQLGQIGERFSTRRGELENTALQGLTGIEQNLQSTIGQILNNATLTLREKDNAIRSAQERAAAARASASGYNPYDIMNALYGRSEAANAPIQEGQVAGAVDDTAIAIDGTKIRRDLAGQQVDPEYLAYLGANMDPTQRAKFLTGAGGGPLMGMVDVPGVPLMNINIDELQRAQAARNGSLVQTPTPNLNPSVLQNRFSN
jgi:hypothetical protein